MAAIKKSSGKSSSSRRAAIKPRAKAGTRKVPRIERMEQMLTAGAQVFALRGYHNASMDEIAQRANISKPLLYRYFQSKEGLYLAIIDRTGRRMIDGFGLIMQLPDPVERIEKVTIGLLTFINRHRDLWLVMYQEAMRHDGPGAERVRYFRDRVIANGCVNISEALGNPTEEGRLEAEPLAHALVASGEAIALWWLSHPEIPVERIQELLLDSSLPILRHLRRKRLNASAEGPG